MSSIEALAITLKYHGKIQESIKLYEECFQVTNKILGLDDFRTKHYFKILRELKGEEDNPNLAL
jgi:hypothetical protein